MVVPRSSSNSSGERKRDLLCRIKYCNKLPDIPFDPKFLIYPFDPNRFVQYHHTSLERGYKHELHTEADLGLDIDLISMDCDKELEESNFNDVDETLLEDEVANTSLDPMKSQRHSKKVSWLRRTEYISSDYKQYQNIGMGAENKVGFNSKKTSVKDIYKDRDSQIEAIENTFEQATKTIPARKNGAYPTEIIDFLPDYDHWKYPFSQVLFDSKPLPTGCTVEPEGLDEKMNHAMIRGMVDEEGSQFVVYFLPTDETITKIKGKETETLEYKLAREYNWSVNKSETSRGYEESLFVVKRDGNMYYNELDTKVKLTKRRVKGKKANKVKLTVKRREMLEDEVAAQDQRMKALEKLELEEEFEEEAAPGTPTNDAKESEDEFGSPKMSPEKEEESQDSEPEPEKKVQEPEEKVSDKELSSSSEDEAKNIFGSDDDDDDDI